MSRRAVAGSPHRFWVVVLGVLLLSATARGAERERADLYLNLDGRGAGDISFVLAFEPPTSLPIEQSLSQTLGVRLQNVQRETEGDRWFLTAHCDDVFHRNGLRVMGVVDPAPLVKQLRS